MNKLVFPPFTMTTVVNNSPETRVLVAHGRVLPSSSASRRRTRTCLRYGASARQARTRRISAWGAALAVLLLVSGRAFAQEQYQGLCAQIKIVISQELTLERIGFLATLQITDNDSTDPITDFAANLTFENHLLSTNGVVDDSSSLFFVQPPTLQNIQDVNGAGVIGPSQTATISWFIIPTVNAGGTSPAGVRYQVGAQLSGKLRGVEIPAATLQVFPAPITVQPDAQLQITYFTPRDVQGDNPFTPQVESPIPFTFGVLVQNVGYGSAHHVVIQSQQPKIAENKQNLLIIAQLLGSRVNDSALSNANLTVDLGDLNPGQTSKGAWDEIVSLSGTFLSVNATYTHATSLGGEKTSLIKSVKAYLFSHEVLDDRPGRDNIRDFLADTSGTLDSIQNLIPDSIYESEGNVQPVNLLTNVAIASPGNPFQINLTADFSGWGYMRLDDPGQALLPLGTVIRSDGKVLNTNNYWTSIHYEPITNFKHTYLNILDLVDLGNYSYTVTYTNVPVDTNPPVTTLLFAGASTLVNGVYYITPQTQMYFVSQDANPVSIYYSLTNSPFLPAYPFQLSAPGQYSVTYYAVDTSGNRETNQTATLVVAGPSALGFAGVTVPSQPMVVAGDALSIRPGTVPITFQSAPNPTPVNAQVDIFQGAVGWATVAGVPSSPTANSSASLTIGGAQVDYYRYRLNQGGWSTERPISAPLVLTGLSVGSNTVSVLGRSQYGGYLDPTNAVIVGWVVDPAAPATTVTGVPATPTHSASAQINVGGANVSAYRWTLNNSYYRPATAAANPLVLDNLNNGLQSLLILGTISGVEQPTNNPTTASWTIDPLYGSDFSTLPAVRSVTYSNVGNAPIVFNWDGRNGAGVIQPPGWYTVRITLADPIGHTNFTTALAQIGSLSGTNLILADVVRGPQNPYARRRWAVWQDQSDGTWPIYAQDVTAANSPILKLTSGTLSQQNPRTDGRSVVWQARQLNGNWDIYFSDMTATNGPQALTSTLNLDEVNPAIDWPWVVCQTRATGNPNAPWLLRAYNLANSQSFLVSSSTQDEIDPDVQAGRVVWQDFRDVGYGEIYFHNLETGEARRITTNTFGQYHPAIYDNWIVWQDNRNTELDIYGFDLLCQREVQITSTPEDEMQPYLNGPWLVCMENSLGPQTFNARLIHLPSFRAVPVTRTATQKSFPALADGFAVWQEALTNLTRIVAAPLPALQPVFQNRNAVVVTDGMVSLTGNAFGLLSLWGSNAVREITQYTSLTPQVTSQTAYFTNGAPSGVNFSLTPGSFLWIKFDEQRVLDLGLSAASALNLAAGANVFGYTHFPDSYSAYQLLRQLGFGNAVAVRMLDSESGQWLVAQVQNGNLIGNDFPIPNVSVLMLELANPVNQFVPQSP